MTLEVLEGWLKAWDKAKAAHQTAESFETGAPDNPDASVLRVVLEEDELFQVCNAFDPQSMKPWKFSPTRKYFEVDSSGPAAPLLADAHARVEHLRQRYWIIHQRLQRVLNGGVFNNSLKLTPIESLTGTLGTKRVLGMVVQKEEGKWYLEDPKASIEMDFSALGKEDSIKSGFFTEGCVCLVSGEVQNDRDAFLVQEICFGGAEPRDVTEKTFPSIDFFGANLEHRLVARLQAYEKHFANDGLDNILLLSDVWLDDAKVMEKLIQVIEGANSAPPFAFVLMGNFVTSANTASMSTYIQCFERLAEALATAPALLQKTRLIFVPGPADPTASRDVLPSPALSKPIRDAFEKRLRRASAGIQRTKSSAHGDFARFFFTSNPVRLRYCTKQIVLFREDISNKLRRHCFLNPATDDMTDHLVRTVCDQSHLCPLPITIKPVYWNYDHAMRLYPLPNMVRNHRVILMPLILCSTRVRASIRSISTS